MPQRVLITGAAGGLGRMFREKLAGYAALRLSDMADLGDAGPGEEIVYCDLSDAAAVDDLVAGCDGIMHLGGQSLEAEWQTILNSNIVGAYNLFEAARRHGKPRIIFASSNHVIGFHTRETRLDGASPQRPDSLYAVSKCFGEALGRYYWDKFAVENVAVRIGSCFSEPLDRRMMATWLSADDFVAMIEAIFAADRVGHTMLYGVSANREQWWDNSHAAYLGWTPKDSSEQFRSKIEAAHPLGDPEDPAIKYQGGGFAKAGHYED